ncbi:hypothetical protein TNCT_348911 [Trichonephila clavata]|uniref:Uncharacterized protein n=1 Tax=Trichonephila clavata TaxID=2740835 RepID=A0A8X6HD88_TRICU|nr:hypothetical protein TNCT_348911 [Trichonephila clavata]
MKAIRPITIFNFTDKSDVKGALLNSRRANKNWQPLVYQPKHVTASLLTLTSHGESAQSITEFRLSSVKSISASETLARLKTEVVPIRVVGTFSLSLQLGQRV